MSGLQIPVLWFTLFLASAAFACDSSNMDPYPHPYDCTKFLICLDGNEVEVSCPKGMEFNPEKHICDQPETAHCFVTAQTTEIAETTAEMVETTTELAGTTTGMAETTSKIAETTAGEAETTTEEAETTTGEAETTTEEAKTTTGEAETTTQEAETTTGEAQTTTEEAETTTGEAQTTTEEAETTTGEAETTTEQAETTTGEAETTTEEAETTAGQAETTTEEAETTTGEAETTTEEVETTTQIQEPTTAAVQTTTRPQEVKCNSTGTAFIPHPTNCRKYYMCSEGIRYLLTCPSGLHFNAHTNQCDFPQFAGCDGSISTEIPPTQTPPPSVQNNTVRPPIMNDPDCLDNEEIYLPNPNNCTEFFECVHGNKYIYGCPGGLHFNADLNICDYPQAAGCQQDKSFSNAKNNVDEPEEIRCLHDGTYNFGDATDCMKYYTCVSRKLYRMSCPPGTLFHNAFKFCDFAAHAVCTRNE